MIMCITTNHLALLCDHNRRSNIAKMHANAGGGMCSLEVL